MGILLQNHQYKISKITAVHCSYLLALPRAAKWNRLIFDSSKVKTNYVAIEFLHYDNTPLQYTANVDGCKNDNFQLKYFDFSLFLLKTEIVGSTL